VFFNDYLFYNITAIMAKPATFADCGYYLTLSLILSLPGIFFLAFSFHISIQNNFI
jgi:hypothetical protein